MEGQLNCDISSCRLEGGGAVAEGVGDCNRNAMAMNASEEDTVAARAIFQLTPLCTSSMRLGGLLCVAGRGAAAASLIVRDSCTQYVFRRLCCVSALCFAMTRRVLGSFALAAVAAGLSCELHCKWVFLVVDVAAVVVGAASGLVY